MKPQTKTAQPAPLTAKEKMVLEFIELFVTQEGIAPSYQEIKNHFGFASFNSVQRYLKQLQAKNYIHIPGDNQKRAITVLHSANTIQRQLTLGLVQKVARYEASEPKSTGGRQLRASSVSEERGSTGRATPVGTSEGDFGDGNKVAGTFSTSSLHSPTPQPHSSSRPSFPPGRGTPADRPIPAAESLSLPLLGRVAAGRPLEALEHDEFIDVPISLTKNSRNCFALKVEGQSMIEDGILDGDMILVNQQSHAKNGDIVVASVDNEATVKRFYLREQQVELRPANSNMKSLWFTPDQVKIQGVVVGLLRKF